MIPKQFHTMRLLIAVLASAWFTVQVASVVELHLDLVKHCQLPDDEHQPDAPWPDDSEQERGDSDENDEEEDTKKWTEWLSASKSIRMCNTPELTVETPLLYDGHGLPPTPPPERA
jgi:hypothetical protein